MTATLNLPRNYVAIEQEEMMYLDGGTWRSYSGTAAARRIINTFVGAGFNRLAATASAVSAVKNASTTGNMGAAIASAAFATRSAVNAVLGRAALNKMVGHFIRNRGFQVRTASFFFDLFTASFVRAL